MVGVGSLKSKAKNRPMSEQEEEESEEVSINPILILTIVNLILISLILIILTRSGGAKPPKRASCVRLEARKSSKRFGGERDRRKTQIPELPPSPLLDGHLHLPYNRPGHLAA